MLFALALEVGLWLTFVALPGGLPAARLPPASTVLSLAALVAIVMGVNRCARAVGMNPLLRVGGWVLALFPVLRLLPIGYVLLRARAAASMPGAEAVSAGAAQAARQRSLSRRQAGTSGAPAAAARDPGVPGQAPQQGGVNRSADADGRERLSQAIPRIRSIGRNLGDGVRMKLKVELPADAPKVDQDKLDMPVTRATAGVFAVQYMVDAGDHYLSVSEGELDRSGLTLDQLHDIAMKNLRRLVAEAKPGLRLSRLPGKDGQGKAIMVLLDGNNEAAMMLLDELWDQAFKKHIPNKAMAVIPARDICVFIDFSAVTEGGLGDLQSVVAGIHERQGHCVPYLLHREQGQWQVSGEVTGLREAKAA